MVAFEYKYAMEPFCKNFRIESNLIPYSSKRRGGFGGRIPSIQRVNDAKAGDGWKANTIREAIACPDAITCPEAIAIPLG